MSNDNKPLVSPGVRVILTDETINIVRDGQTIIPEPFRSPLRGVPTDLLVWWDVEYDLLAEWESDPQMFADWEVDVQLVANWEADVQLVANWESDPQMFADWEVVLPEIVLQWDGGRALAHSTGIVNTVTYGNGTYVLGWWDWTAEYSTDGVTWNAVSATMNLVYGSAYGQGKFIIVGGQSNSSGPGRIADSVDGTVWTNRLNPFGTVGSATILQDILYSPELNLWMLMNRGSPRGYKTSTDGLTWSATVEIPDFGSNGYYRGSWGDGKFVLTDTKSIAISTDAVNWTVIQNASLPMDGIGDRIYATAAGNGTIVALGDSTDNLENSGMYSLDNGVTWNLISAPGTNNLQYESVQYGNGQFIASNNIPPSFLAISNDGINWDFEPNFVYGSSITKDIVYNSDANEWVMVGDRGYTVRGRYVEITPPPPVPEPGPAISGDWSVDLLTTTSTSNTSAASPINIWWNRRVFTTTYSAAEVAAATGKTSATISGLRFLVSGAPAVSIPDYAIGMKVTTNHINANSGGTSGGTFALVKNPSLESFTTGVTKEFIFDTPIVWTNAYNLVVSWAWSAAAPSGSGQMPINSNNGSSWHDQAGAGTFNIDDPTPLGLIYRPVIQLRT